MKEIDARGLACPAPVLKTRAALESEAVDVLKVLVDNPASQQNVQRFLESRGFVTTRSQEGNEFIVTGHGKSMAAGPAGRSEGAPRTAAASVRAAASTAQPQKIMVVCATDRIGSGDDDLGRSLMVNFIRTLKEMGTELWRLVFVNNGVKLAVAGSPVLAELQEYEKTGLGILVCGTCLNHFDLLEQKRCGETTNMLDIVTAMQVADKVITMG